MIAFQCSSCGQSFEVDDSLAGKKGRCRNCGQIFTVPGLREGTTLGTTYAGETVKECGSWVPGEAARGVQSLRGSRHAAGRGTSRGR